MTKSRFHVIGRFVAYWVGHRLARVGRFFMWLGGRFTGWGQGLVFWAEGQKDRCPPPAQPDDCARGIGV